MIEKKNDWVATLLNTESHPEITEEILYANGITPDNTGIKDSDYYRNIPQIQEKFTKNGKFDESSYQQFYNSALRSYNSYSNKDFVNSLLDYYGTSKYDISTLSNPAQNVYKTSAIITNFYDRNRHSYGTGNLWEMGDANFSDREVAQANKVRDENGNVLDWTPNDKGGLIKGLFRPSLVMASYDEDVYDENGVLIHQKGELKLDENGDPYTELLGNRDSYGKDVVKITDTLTIDGTKLNDWDPFDSDGLNKSIGSTIAKTLFTLGPFFIPYVGPTLGVISALTGIASSLPTLGKTIDSFITGGDDDSFGRSMTTIENAMSRFGFSQSDAAKGKFLSLENIGDIFTSSAGQLFSQRMIGQVPKVLAKLQQTNNINKKLGQQLSLGYMALTSANDSYGVFKEAGANDWTASLGMLLTLGGYWGLMNTGYFKEKLFEGSFLDEEQQLRRTFTDAAKEINKDLHGTDLEKVVFKKGGFWDRLENAESKFPQFLGKSAKKIKEAAQKMPIGRPGGTENAFISRALNEGIEETMEEGMQDSIKALTKGLELIGLNVTEDPDDTLDFGMTPEEMLQRYASSFVGGALGGATFEVFNQVELFRNPELKKLYKMAPVRRMVYDLQDSDNLDRYIRTIDKLYKNGKLGNKNLSATEYESVSDPENKTKATRVYKQGTDDNNQNLAVRNLLLGITHQIHDVLQENGLIHSGRLALYALTNPKLQEEIRKSGLSIEEYWKQNNPDIIASTLHDIGVLDTAVRQAKGVGEQIFNLSQKIESYKLNSRKNLQLETKSAELDKALKEDKDYQFLQDQLKVLREKYDDIVGGKNGDEYMGFAYMLLEDSPLKYYTNLFDSTTKNGESKSITTVENFADVNFNIDYASLDENSETKKYIDDQFKDFIVGKEQSFWKIWDFHKNLEEKYADTLEKADNFLKDHKIDPFHKSVTIGEWITDSIKIRDQKLAKLAEFQLNPEEVEQSDIINLSEEITALNTEIETFQRLNPSLHLNEVFDLEKFQQLMDPDVSEDEIDIFNNDAQVNAAKQNVISYYKYLKDNKIVAPTKEFLTDYLSKFLGKLGLTVNSEMTKKIKSWLKVSQESDGFKRFVFKDQNIDELDPDDVIESLNGAREEALGLFDTESKMNEFISSLEEFLTLLQLNPSQALSKYQELLDEVKKSINFDALNALVQDDIKYDAELLLNELLFSKHTDTIEFVSNIINDIDSLDVSPTFDILQDLSVKMTGGYNKIIDLLQQQRQNLGSGLANFQLNNTMKNALDQAQLLLNIFTALIDSAQSNLNTKVNEYRIPLGKKPFAEISAETKNILLKDIEYLQSQIDYLKTLGGANLEKRLVEQQEIMKNDTVKRIKFFVEHSDEKSKLLVTKLETLLGIKFADLWDGDFDISSDSKFAEFDKNRIEFETKLFTAFDSNSDSQKANLIQNIASLFQDDPTFLSSNAGLLTSDDSTVTMYGMYRYLLLNLLTNSKQVASWYKTVMKGSSFVPFYSQELIIKDALANYLNRSLYNTGLEVLEQKKNDNSDSFIKDSIVLRNFLFINGVPGAGKTAVIANTIKKMIRLIDGDDSTKFISLSMTEVQAKKLATSIEEPNSDLTWSEFIKANTTTEGEEYSQSDGHRFIKNFKSKLSFTEITKDPKVKKVAIFFDEIQLLREPDIIKLNQLVKDANDNGYEVMVFGLGDLMQTSVSENNNEISIVNTLFNSSFRLSASFRETNQGKSENTLAIASKLQTVMEHLYNDKGYQLQTANKDTDNAFSTRTELRWYDDGKTIYGDKFIKSSDIDKTLDKLKSYVGQHNSNSNNPEIAIVVESEEDKQAYALKINNDPRIGIYTKIEISGGEFDYVLIDSKLSNNSFLSAKEFYTLMSRARNASFFVAEKTQILNLYSSDSGTPSAANLLSSKDDEQQKKIYDTFKEWRMKLFEGIEETNTPKPQSPEGEGTGESKTGEFDTAPGTAVKKYDTPDSPTEQEINDFLQQAESEIEEKKKQKTLTSNETALDNRKSRSNPTEDPNKPTSIKDRISTSDNDCDCEVYEEWLKTNNPTTLGKCILTNIQSEKGIEQYKDFLRYFSSFILNLSSDPDTRTQQIRALESSVKTGEGDIGDNLRYALSWISRSLKDDTGYYYTTLLDDKHSLLYYVFNNPSGKMYAIPVTIINGTYNGVVCKNIQTEKVADFAFISSNGKFHLDPRIVAKGKVSINPFYGTVVNKTHTSTVEGLRNQEGKSFAIFGILNGLIENDEELLKDFLDFEFDEDGNIVSYYKRTSTSKSPNLRIRGIQRRLSISEFIELCDLIKKEHTVDTVEKWQEAREAIAKKLNIKEYKTNVKLAKQLGEQEPDTSQRVRLMTGEARKKLINAIHKVIAEQPILGNGISKFWLDDIYNKNKGPHPVIQIGYETGASSITILLKKVGNKLVWCDASGVYRNGTDINDSNSFDLPDVKGTWREFITSILSSIKKLDVNGNYSVIPNNLSKDDFYSHVSVDYLLDGSGSEGSYTYQRYIEDLINIFDESQLRELQNNIEADPEFVHGVYLNLQVETFLNIEEGQADARWGINSYDGTGTITSDDVYVFAPIYNITLSENGRENKTISELDNPNHIKTQDLIIKNTDYNKEGTAFRFNRGDVQVSKNWLINSISEKSNKKIPSQGEVFFVHNIDPQKKTITIWINAGTSDLIDLELKEDFDFSLLDNFSENKVYRTKAWDNNHTLIIDKEVLKIETSGSKQISPVTIIGENNLGFYYLVDDTYQFYKYDDTENELDQVLKGILSSYSIRGSILSVIDNIPIFVKTSRSGYEFTILNNENQFVKVSYDPSTGTISGKNITLQVDQTFKNAFDNYQNNNIDNIRQFKNDVIEKFKSYGIFNDGILNDIESYGTIDQVVDFANDILIEQRYLFNDGKQRTVTVDNGKLKIIERLDPAITLGYILLKNRSELNNQPSAIKSIEKIEDSNNYLVTLHINDQDKSEKWTLFKNDQNQWDIKPYNEISESLNSIFEMDNLIFTDENKTFFKDYFNKLQQHEELSEDENQIYDDIHDALDSKIQEELDKLVLSLIC